MNFTNTTTTNTNVSPYRGDLHLQLKENELDKVLKERSDKSE